MTSPYFEEHTIGAYGIFTITVKEQSCIYRPVIKKYSHKGSHSQYSSPYLNFEG
jgi:hypothetical protein